MDSEPQAPLIQIGLVLSSGSSDTGSSVGEVLVPALEKQLAEQFPAFSWKFETVQSRHHTEDELRDPLHLIETAFREKVARHWDTAVLVTDTMLRGTTRPFAAAIPASALEVGVVSRGLFEEGADDCDKTTAVIIYLLGSLWGLPPASPGAMHLPERICDIEPAAPFTEKQREWLMTRLTEISDTRLEENSAAPGRRNLPLFYLRSLAANPRGVFSDVLGYRPWWQPFRLSRLTAAAVVSMLFVFLGAEAWEIGIHLDPKVLATGAVLSVLAATASIYSGQNLSEIAPVGALSEQLARTRLVLFFCVLIGMISLGLVLFVISLLAASVIPGHRLEVWTGVRPELAHLVRFSTFAALLGVLAGALGGNLEENQDLKARFFFDEER
ncbi:MAG: hypothetical protein P1U86_03265 [Verrucomicrobiales bacterium]|nr:hypothetical protein [Verrucomicrobiales bacterium]